ncbi:MAG: Gfo/Idh/MocA family oxidoreductase [Candidatus Sumerlaeota bacterium]|nr:Gfo/Idh/MocA family oxidoreductase [Candidatus Sumerlaeota bacterium]
MGLIGAGEQGNILMDAMRYIPGVRVKAVCDIWQYQREQTIGRFRKYGGAAIGYEDYREMLDHEKDLSAVIVATPDWMHAEQTIAALEAGKHVYCESEMSNSLEQARQMVLAQRRTGKLLQIGRQRRSNPRYIYAIENLLQKTRLLGRVTNAYSQWNRSRHEDRGWPERYPVPPDILAQHGYQSMQQLRNWRWFKKFSAGPLAELGSHQIDVLAWAFGGPPKSVIISGGIDYYRDQEWPDNIMAIFEFKSSQGVARAFYQIQTTTGYGAFQEIFMGENGSLRLSEVPACGNAAIPEKETQPNFEAAVSQGALLPLPKVIKKKPAPNVIVDVRVSEAMEGYPIPVRLNKPFPTPHLENFFDAIRLGSPLHCPAHSAYQITAALSIAKEAINGGRKIEFDPKDFVA